MKSKKELPKTDWYVCRECGNTVEGSALDRCPVCGAPKSAFFKAPYAAEEVADVALFANDSR